MPKNASFYNYYQNTLHIISRKCAVYSLLYNAMIFLPYILNNIIQ